jgi:SAM-dependent methyltransferase
MSNAGERKCWCGHEGLEPFSPSYQVCRACGTLVSQGAFSPDLYAHGYWTGRQTEHHGLPDITRRARLDLPERCTHWLRHLLSLRIPPGRVLEVGCSHGAYVALLGWAGFEARGTELSPEAVAFARREFRVTVSEGKVEDQGIEPQSCEVIVLNDVLEHLPAPAVTISHCARFLSTPGFFVIQTPEYKEHLSYADLKSSKDLFLKHIEGMEAEHLYLFSRRSAGLLFSRLGFPAVAFANPVYPYDLFFAASREPLAAVPEAEAVAALTRTPEGRLAQALLDKAFESADRWWAIERLAGRAG